MLEYAVRPYTSPNAQGRILIPSTPGATRDRATLTWGADSTLPQPLFGNVSVACCQKDQKEKSREAETVRIYGNDPDNWIDVSRAHKMKIKEKTKGSQELCNDDSQMYSPSMQSLSDAFSDAYWGFTPLQPAGSEDCDITFTLTGNTTPG